jgi:hypothetical protein
MPPCRRLIAERKPPTRTITDPRIASGGLCQFEPPTGFQLVTTSAGHPPRGVALRLVLAKAETAGHDLPSGTSLGNNPNHRPMVAFGARVSTHTGVASQLHFRPLLALHPGAKRATNPGHHPTLSIKPAMISGAENAPTTGRRTDDGS